MSEAARRLNRLFSSFPVDQINFQIGGLPVTPRGFADVGYDIGAERIELRRGRNMPPGVGAIYRWQEDVLIVPENLTAALASISGRSLVVHEGVHIMIDRNRAVATTTLTAEAAAYLAQVIYRLRSSEDLRPWIEAQRTSADGAIYYQALQLIDRFSLLSRAGAMSMTDTEPLRQAINQHPLYRDVSPSDLHGADGIH